jgi:hypothetical protein
MRVVMMFQLSRSMSIVNHSKPSSDMRMHYKMLLHVCILFFPLLISKLTQHCNGALPHQPPLIQLQVKAERMGGDVSIEEMQQHTVDMVQKMHGDLAEQGQHEGTPNPDDAAAIKENLEDSRKVMQSENAPQNPL